MCDLLRQEYPVAKTKISQKFPSTYKAICRSDVLRNLSPCATCCSHMLPRVFCADAVLNVD